MDVIAVAATVGGAGLPVGARLSIGGVLGLIAGSYFATVLVRWPRGESANHGRSRCDGCGRRLAWHELVPLASYLRLGGRCAACGTPIARLHPLVELGCGLLGAYAFAMGAPAEAPLAWLLLLLALFDARMLWLPDRLVAPLALVCIAVPAWDPDMAVVERLIAGATAFIGLWLVGWAFRALTRREGLGGGDPKLLGAIGLWIGWRDLPLLLFVACAIGLVDALLRWPKDAARGDVHLPLGAYLCVAALGFVIMRSLIMAP